MMQVLEMTKSTSYGGMHTIFTFSEGEGYAR